jgi:preprotein translocase subunit Sec61beta
MAKDKTRMPMSTAGITTYFEDYKSKIEFKPGHIIIFSIVVVLVVVALHIWGTGLLGAA